MKNEILPIFLSGYLLFFSSFKSQAQDLSYHQIDSLMTNYVGQFKVKKALGIASQGLEKSRAEFGEQDSTFAHYCMWMGYLHNKGDDSQLTISFYKQALSIYEKVHGHNHPNYSTALNSLAYTYHKIEDFEKALALYMKASELQKNNFGENDMGYATTLNNLALLHYAISNYEMALTMMKQVVVIIEKKLGEKHPNYATTVRNLAGLYDELGETEKAIELLLKVKKIEELVLGQNHPNLATTYNNLATIYQKNGLFEKSQPLLIRATNIYRKVLGDRNVSYALALLNLAGEYEKTGQNEKALPMMQEALGIYAEKGGKQSYLYIKNLNILADLYVNIKQYSKAWLLIDQNLQQIIGCDLSKRGQANWLDSLKNIQFSSNRAIDHSVAALVTAYRILQEDSTYRQSKEIQMDLIDLANTWLHRAKVNMSHERGKLRLIAQTNDWLHRSLEILDPAVDQRRAFEYADLNKSVLLLQATRSKSIYHFGNLPDSISLIEKKLHNKYSKLEAFVNEKRPQKELDSLSSLLIETNQELVELDDQIKQSFPKYHEFKQRKVLLKLESLQKLLKDKTAVIEYVIGDSAVHVFKLTQKKLSWKVIPMDKNLLENNIDALHSSLSNYSLIHRQEKKAYRQYTLKAYWFYQQLLKPVLDSNSSINNLVIITDGILGHLPFESFLTMPAPQSLSDYHRLAYLIKDYNVSYNYSAAIWKENEEASRAGNNGQMLAMAANYKFRLDSSKFNLRLPTDRWMRSGLVPLPGARKEVQGLEDKYQGFFAFDSIATEKVVKGKASEYAILHFALHGILNENRPMLSSLAFTEDGDSVESGFLQAHEISKMELKADLVVLSACETGYGRFEKGNGIASLARSFMYAGVPSMVVSLWQVNDFATSKVMKYFYKNLSEGMYKDEALRNAKLRYVESANGVLAHPAFWSPFIQIGTTKPVQIKTKGGSYLSLLFVGLAVVALGALLYKSAKKAA